MRYLPFCFLSLLALLTPLITEGWIYPEHRRIALLAIQKLSPEDRAVLDRIWAEARTGMRSRLTASVIDPGLGLKPGMLDYPSWAAIAGDHSCSPEDLVRVLRSDWILKVAAIAAQLQIDIEQSTRRSQHVNAIRNSDIRLQRADPDYATRAGSNNAHFLLARPSVSTDPREYLLTCLKEGTELNALGVYSWFHTSALLKAARYAKENLSPEEKSNLMLSALADEAFALHFLEDVYAAGHMAGTWGETPVRKGTHDFYNEKGLEIVTWDGRRFISLGDAYMRGEDEAFAAENVRQSLEQILGVAAGKVPIPMEESPFVKKHLPDTFNVCRNNVMASYSDAGDNATQTNAVTDMLKAVLIKTPVPGLATGLGEIPRFRSELGMFLGISGALNGHTNYGGYSTLQTENGAVGGVEANARFGFGLDGVLNQAGDGLVFIQVGIRQDAASSNQFGSATNTIPAGAVTSAIPGRGAFNIRMRLPFWLLPGDLLIAGPILALTSPKTLTRMAVTAGNGGAIPWQSGIATRFGRFQFVAGREIGVSLYGKVPKDDEVLIPNANNTATLVNYSSVKLDFPLIEYRPFRSFSTNQSADILVQFSTGVDIPQGANVIVPITDPVPSMKPVWYLGLRLIFDWRYYL
ncbi:MAG TPA: hypothetical protein PLR06_02940 [Cyclobacteriaceae bacterium]|nr:hypothetical protein [Cyclobacteriaceae bacterium]